jgi:cytochrome c oxidase subunit 2
MRRSVLLVAILLVPACIGAGSGSSATDAPESVSPPTAIEHVVKVTAKRFEFSPDVIRLKVHVPVVIELTSLDRLHGFEAPDLRIDEQIAPGAPTLVRLTPDKVGTYPFHCSVFCGEGHESMGGRIVVEP